MNAYYLFLLGVMKKIKYHWEKEIRNLQEQVINISSLFIGVVALITAVAVFVGFADFGNLNFYLSMISVLGMVLVGIFRKKISSNLKMLTLISAIFLLTVSSFFAYGFISSAKIAILIVPLYISFTMSYRKALFAFLAFLLLYLSFAILFSTGVLVHTDYVISLLDDYMLWVIDAIALVTVAIGLLFIGKTFWDKISHQMEELEEQKNTIKISEEKFRAIFEGSNDAILWIEDGKIIECNQRTLDMFESDKESLIGKPPYLISPEFQLDGSSSKEKAILLIDKAIKGEPQTFDWRHQKHNGEGFCASINLSVVKLHDKEYLQASLRDITEHNKIKLALKRSEMKLEKVVYATTDGMWEWNLIENTVIYDPRYYELIGYQANEFPHRLEEFTNRLHPEDVDYVLECANKYIAGDTEKYIAEFRLQKKDKTYMWIQGKGAILERDMDGVPLVFVGTHTDITLRRNIQEELESHKNNLEHLVNERTHELQSVNEELTSVNHKLLKQNSIIERQKQEMENTLQDLKKTQANLIQSEKMASLGVLTAGVAHEVNNPLNYIMGGLLGLETFFNKNEELAKDNIPLYLSSIKEGVERATKIITGLNQFSRENQVYDEDCNLNDIINNCLLMLNSELKYRIDIEKNYIDDNIIIKGNTGKLHQVFINLLVNSTHAIEEQGIIKITTKKENDNVFIEVEDSGCGISEENISKIADPFFTTRDPGEGTGLGLSITYKILQEHNATLEFQSKLGKGTLAKITFNTINTLKLI